MRALIDTTAGADDPSTIWRASRHPAGFLASSRRTALPPTDAVRYRPATSPTDPSAPTDVAASTPSAAALAVAMAALARLARPGSARSSGRVAPSAVRRASPSSHSDGVGRANVQSRHAQ